MNELNIETNKVLFRKLVRMWGSLRLTLGTATVEEVRIPLADGGALIIRLIGDQYCSFGLLQDKLVDLPVSDERLVKFLSNVMETIESDDSLEDKK